MSSCAAPIARGLLLAGRVEDAPGWVHVRL